MADISAISQLTRRVEELEKTNAQYADAIEDLQEVTGELLRRLSEVETTSLGGGYAIEDYPDDLDIQQELSF